MTTVSEASALALLDRMRSALFDFEAALTEFITAEAWTALGHNSFAECWAANMSDITIAAELRPLVVYRMFDDGATDEDIQKSVKGVGAHGAEELRRQKKNGVPAGMARVRQHNRRHPAPPRFVTVDVGPELLAHYKQVAHDHGTTVEIIAADALSFAVGILKRQQSA